MRARRRGGTRAARGLPRVLTRAAARRPRHRVRARRGVLEWQGQLLLKGKDDAVPIKLVGGSAPAAAPTPAVAADEVVPVEEEAPAAAKEEEVEVS